MRIFLIFLQLVVCTQQTQLRSLGAAPGGIIDRTIDSLTALADSKNLSQVLLDKIGNVTPPIDKTFGINDLTRIFTFLPEDAKQALINKFPDSIDFPTTAFWSAVADKWKVIMERSDDIQEELNEAGLLEPIREFISLPFAVYDTKVAGVRNMTQPFYDTRTRFIQSRDAVLDSIMAKQKAVWEPAVNRSESIGSSIKESRRRISDFADSLILNRVSNTLYDIRSLLLRFNTNRIYTSRAAKMCALNPICCEDPSRCVPVELNNQF